MTEIISAKPLSEAFLNSSTASVTETLKTQDNASQNTIFSSYDVPMLYQLKAAPTEDEIQGFLNNFAQDNHIYSLINNLNNKLKGLFREMRETEASSRVKQYIKQFDIALEKRDEIIIAAAEIKELKLKAADLKMIQGIVEASTGGMSVLSDSEEVPGVNGLIGGAMKIFDSRIEKLNILAEDVRMRLDALQTEKDAEINLAKQKGELAGSFMNLLDGLNNTFSTLINELHSSHNSTIAGMGKGMV